MSQPIRHSWDLSPTEAIALQRELAGLVRPVELAGPVRTIAGVDCAFLPGGRQIVAAAVLLSWPGLEALSSAYALDAVRFPYVPGLLSFREAPAEITAIEQLPQRPDLLMVDGAGLGHPRRLGIASHVGLWLGIPTIGVAKSRLCGTHREVGLRRGCRVQLRDDGEIIGAVLRTQPAVRPLYVSVGHLITLGQAVHWTLTCAQRYRLPEPTRAADHLAGRLKAML